MKEKAIIDFIIMIGYNVLSLMVLNVEKKASFDARTQPLYTNTKLNFRDNVTETEKTSFIAFPNSGAQQANTLKFVYPDLEG